MTWKVRHEGSPRAIEGLNETQVVEGLSEGLWEPTDEVMGPSESAWTALESHPRFAEVVAEMEPPPRAEPEDEARLDMNPLIDVALVLLIFFILVTSYAALQKLLEMPTTSEIDPNTGVRVVKPQDAMTYTVLVTATPGADGKTVITVEQDPTPVDEKYLASALRGYRSQKGVTQLLIKAESGVEWGSVVAIQDAGKEAGFDKALLSVPPSANQKK